MQTTTQAILSGVIDNYPELGAIEADISEAFELLADCYRRGGKILVCGNGGSAADADHIVGELMKGFALERKMPPEQREIFASEPELIASLQQGIPAISLSAHTALATAYINDKRPEMVYAQQVYGYLRPADVFIGITTSGNSTNVVYAAKVAKILGGRTVALVGASGGTIASIADVTIKAPQTETYKVQQLHLPIYHGLCLMLENEFFGRHP